MSAKSKYSGTILKKRDFFKNNFLLIVLLILILNKTGYTQEYLFKVISFSGSPHIIKNNSGKESSITINMVINKSDEIVLNSGDYLYLMDKDGKTFFFKETGRITGLKISQNLNKGNDNALKKFTDYLVGEIVKKKKELGNMKDVGAVTRKSLENTIVLNVPFSTSLCDQDNLLSWYSPKLKGETKFTLLDEENDVRFSIELKDTFYMLNLNAAGLEYGKKYRWFVESVEDAEIKSDTAYLYMPEEEESLAFIDTLNLYKEQYKKYTMPVKYIVLAMFYEKHGYLLNAMMEYENAIYANPESRAYRYLYIDFLLKQGMDLKAIELYESTRK